MRGGSAEGTLESNRGEHVCASLASTRSHAERWNESKPPPLSPLPKERELVMTKTPPSQPASGERLPGGRLRGWQHAQHKQPVLASFHVLSLGARSHWTACQANSEIAGSSLVRAPELDQVIRAARRFDRFEKSAVFSIRQWLGPLEWSGWHLHGRSAQRPAAHRQFRHPAFIVIDGDAR
jgi:hypothetical protein